MPVADAGTLRAGPDVDVADANLQGQTAIRSGPACLRDARVPGTDASVPGTCRPARARRPRVAAAVRSFVAGAQLRCRPRALTRAVTHSPMRRGAVYCRVVV
eukprot:2877658-Rhodomonas_salina.1